MKPLIVISGPTASGKTSFSVELAKKIKGEIICADSMQIYQLMDIGSATPTVAEKQGITHHLFGLMHPTQQFSVAQYATIAHQTISEVHERGHIPILVGGTGLYIDTVVNNISLSETKEDPLYRHQLYALAERMGDSYLHQMLELIDPNEAKKLPSGDTRRIIRALEIYKTIGKTKTEQNKLSKMTPRIYKSLQFGIHMERDILYDRINRRVDIMLVDGLLQEVENLLKIGVNSQMTSMQGIGYKELADYLNHKTPLDKAIDEIKKRTRHYAKRQMTWFRRNEDMIWLFVEEKGKSLEKCIKCVEKL